MLGWHRLAVGRKRPEFTLFTAHPGTLARGLDWTRIVLICPGIGRLAQVLCRLSPLGLQK
jgi:hypothetical protein